MQIKEARLVKPKRRNDTCSETDVFKEIQNSNENDFFASIRARMEAASEATSSNESQLSLDDQYVNAPLLATTKKTHFDYDEVSQTLPWVHRSTCVLA